MHGSIVLRVFKGTLKVLLQHIDNDFEAWPLIGATLDKIRDIQTYAFNTSIRVSRYFYLNSMFMTSLPSFAFHDVSVKTMYMANGKLETINSRAFDGFACTCNIYATYDPCNACL